MGRTQLTYRTRYQIIRKNLIGIYNGDKTKYSDLWNYANDLSAPSSTLPYGDTHAITCLLYTSPSPRDRTRSRMPCSA